MNLAITGVGVVSPAGIGKTDFYSNLASDTTGISEYASSPFFSKAGVITDFSIKPFTKNFKLARSLSKASHFSLAATRLAAEEAEFPARELEPYQTGIIVATNYQSGESSVLPLIRAYKDSTNAEGRVDYARFSQKGLRRLPTKFLLQSTPNIAAFICGYELSVNGYSNTIISGGNSFFEALIETNLIIRNKTAAVVFCGASDSLLNPPDILGLVSRKAETVKTDSLIPGEGAVFFLLEDPSTETQTPYRHRCGTVSACTGTRLRTPEDISSVMQEVLSSAGLWPDDIDAIVGCQDAVPCFSKPILETIGAFFAKKKNPLPICSSLPWVGYTRAAAGAFDLALAVYMLETGDIPLLSAAVLYKGKPGDAATAGTVEKKPIQTVLIINIGGTGCVYASIIKGRT